MRKYKKWITKNVHSPEYQCKYWTEQMQNSFPELRIVRGYYIPVNGGKIPHWWLLDPGDLIVDPTASQFSQVGHYEQLDESQKHPTGKCINCGELCYTQECVCSDKCGHDISRNLKMIK